MSNKLTPLQSRVLFDKHTEPPGSGKYYKFDKEGNYYCVNCNQLIFSSKDKFDSNSGWPSFTKPIENAVKYSQENDGRIEVICSNCDAHLGHVFDDGPTMLKGKKTSGKRYCINSVCLDFNPNA